MLVEGQKPDLTTSGGGGGGKGGQARRGLFSKDTHMCI